MPGNFVKVLIQPTAEDEDLFALVCVRIWMELAITNIIQNSVKYSDNKEVLITLSGDRSGFLVQISDEGIGIPPEELPHILEPFFRASNTTPYSGYGIGLPLAARIIRLHGGSINIVSKEASGTQVSVRFPFTPGIKI
jgi:signal transduction histidine kinase